MVGYIQSPHAHSANPPAPWSETTTGRRSVAPRGKATRPIPSSPMGSIHTPPSAASLGGATTTAKLPGVEGMGLGGSHPRQRARATQTVASELGRMVGLSRDPARCDEQPRGSWRHDDGARSKTNEQSQWLLLRPVGIPMEKFEEIEGLFRSRPTRNMPNIPRTNGNLPVSEEPVARGFGFRHGLARRSE